MLLTYTLECWQAFQHIDSQRFQPALGLPVQHKLPSLTAVEGRNRPNVQVSLRHPLVVKVGSVPAAVQLLWDVRLFLDSNKEVASRIMDHLRAVMEDDNRLCRLKLELAAIIDIGRHFVAATYDLEGDGALAFAC